MIVSIVACGESAREWYKTPCDLSIGCNDCVKFGHEVDYLVIVNAPDKFNARAKNGFADRIGTITRSKPKRFFCYDAKWKPYFPNYELLALKPFSGSVQSGRVYKSVTSPFVAITLAFSHGATDIILWGVDLVNHPNIKNKTLSSEVSNYKRLFDALERKHVNVWLGKSGTVFDGFLRFWPVNVA